MSKINFIQILMITLLITSCKSERIDVSFKKSNYQIILRLAKDNNSKFIRVQFPNNIILKNNTNKDISIVDIDYKYANIPKDRNIGFQIYTNNTKNNVKRTGKKTIQRGQTLKYNFYTRHWIDTSYVTQNKLSVYRKELLEKQIDTLHIGTITNFKKNHPELFNSLTKGDSIFIQQLNGKKLGEYISSPIDW